MNKQTTSTTRDDLAEAEATYNMLMWDIEPELTLDMLPEVELLYADEAKEDRDERHAWYAEAFEIFRERAKDLKIECKEALQKALRRIEEFKQERDHKGEMKKISSIEKSLEQS